MKPRKQQLRIFVVTWRRVEEVTKFCSPNPGNSPVIEVGVGAETEEGLGTEAERVEEGSPRRDLEKEGSPETGLEKEGSLKTDLKKDPKTELLLTGPKMETTGDQGARTGSPFPSGKEGETQLQLQVGKVNLLL